MPRTGVVGVDRQVGAVVIVAALAVIGTMWLPASAQAQQDGEQTLSECDRYIEAYLRSAARKLLRPLSRGDYDLQPVELDDPFEVTGETLGLDDPVQFELLREGPGDGRVIGVVDRRRMWEQTYLVANSAVGPIVISHRWQARHLRDAGQACRPIASSVQWPPLTASSVDPEPFDYWGLRAVWRIPPVDTSEPSTEELEEVLITVMRQFAGVDDGDP